MWGLGLGFTVNVLGGAFSVRTVNLNAHMLLGTRTNKSLLCADRIQACNVDHEHKRRYRGISPNQGGLLVGSPSKSIVTLGIKGDLFFRNSRVFFARPRDVSQLLSFMTHVACKKQV